MRHADVVSLHMNLSDANRAYINAARLALMKPGAYLVNCARGGLINEGDVAAALQRGQLAGYGADVVEQEPVVPTNPLLTAPNVVLTPHVGSRTYERIRYDKISAGSLDFPSAIRSGRKSSMRRMREHQSDNINIAVTG